MCVCTFNYIFTYLYVINRFLKKETATIVRVKPTSDPGTTFIAFTICPEFHSAYKKDSLSYYNISEDDYRYKSVWYPTDDRRKSISGREVFHNVTYELHEIIDNIEMSTMSLIEPKININILKELDRRYVKFTVKYVCFHK